MILVSEEFRQRLFVDIPFYKELWMKVKALLRQEERKRLEDKINDKEKELNKLKGDVKEFRSGNVVIKRANFIHCKSFFQSKYEIRSRKDLQ